MTHEALRLAHILGAIGWVGSAFALHMVGRVMARSHADVGVLIRHGQAFAVRIFPPAGLLTIVSGVALVMSGPARFTDLWVMLGIGGVVVSSGVQAGITGPAERQLADTVTSSSLRRWLRGGLLDSSVLVAVVAVMVVRPGM